MSHNVYGGNKKKRELVVIEWESLVAYYLVEIYLKFIFLCAIMTLP